MDVPDFSDAVRFQLRLETCLGGLASPFDDRQPADSREAHGFGAGESRVDRGSRIGPFKTRENHRLQVPHFGAQPMSRFGSALSPYFFAEPGQAEIMIDGSIKILFRWRMAPLHRLADRRQHPHA